MGVQTHKIRAAAAAAALCLALTGCAGAGEHGLSTKDPVSLSIWHYYNGVQKQQFDELVSEFNETVGAEKGIVVEAFSKGNVNELSEQVMAAMEHQVGAGEIPDVFAAYADTAYAIYQQGLAADVGSYMTDEEKALYRPEYLSEGRFCQEDELILFPVAKSTEVFVLNATDWEAFAQATGASEASFATWEGLARVAEEYYRWTDSLTPVPDDGKAFFGRDAFANYPIIGCYQLEAELFSVEDGKLRIQLNEAAWRRLWDNYYLPYVNGYYTEVGRFRSDDVKTGEILACVCSTSGAAYFPTDVTRMDGSSYPIETRVYPLPNFEGARPCAVQQGAGMVVTRKDERTEYAASLFLKWFTEPAQNLRFSIGSGYLPVTVAANDQALMEQAIAAHGEIPPVLAETLRTGIAMTQSYAFYTSSAFEGGDAARKLVDSSLAQRAIDDRARVLALMEAGYSRTQAVTEVATEDAFSEWFDGFWAQLEAIVN